MPPTLRIQPAEYEATNAAFVSGSVAAADRQSLQAYLLAISQNVTGDDAVQSRDIVQALTLNHLILQRHIDELERRGGRTQKLVIALTIASLLGTAVQCWLAYKADGRSEMEAKTKREPTATRNMNTVPHPPPSAGVTEKPQATSQSPDSHAQPGKR